MTPTAQIAAIRQRAKQAYPRGVSDIRHDGTPVYTQMGDPVADVRSLLQQIDARESALRALVAQIEARAKECYDISLCVDDFAHSCIQQAKATAHLADAAELERLLESEQ